jgi:hypothetical protein
MESKMTFRNIRLAPFCLYFLLVISLGPFSIAFAQEHKAGKDKEENYINSGSFEGGEIADDLDVKEMKWSKHGKYERIILYISKWGGHDKPKETKPADVPGYFKISSGKNHENLDVQLGGYRAFTAKLPRLEKSNMIRDITLPTGEKLATGNGFSFVIGFKIPVQFEVFELHSPARIVIDFKRSKPL